MPDATPPQSPEQQTPESSAPRMRARHRAPKSSDAKLRGLQARKVERQLQALKQGKDVAKLEKAAALLAELNGAEAPKKEPAGEPAATVPDSTPPAAQEVRGTPPGVNPRGPSWPSEAAIAELAPLVRQGVDQLAAVLAGTRFAIDGETRVDVGGTTVTVSKANTLTEGLTPLAAKYLPASLNTPEATAAVALMMVFGAPLLQLALEKMTAARAGAS